MFETALNWLIPCLIASSIIMFFITVRNGTIENLENALEKAIRERDNREEKARKALEEVEDLWIIMAEVCGGTMPYMSHSERRALAETIKRNADKERIDEIFNTIPNIKKFRP